MKIKRQKHSVKTKIRLFCSKEEPLRSSWSRIRVTGSAEDTEKQQEEDPVAKTWEDDNRGEAERPPDEARWCHWNSRVHKEAARGRSSGQDVRRCNSGVAGRRPNESRYHHSAVEDSESHDRKNYAEWECLQEKHTLKKCCLKQHKSDRVCEGQLFQNF